MIESKSRVAIYCRLSEEDRNKQSETDDSNSIQNQKSMLLQYSLEHGWEVYNIYSDDDYTGSDRRRPEFNRLLEDAKNRKFDIVLCKTQSRFTRELELVEKYIHGLFPIWGIRFISIVDNADTANKGNKKSRQINGLVNEWYLEDMSENIKSVLTDRRKNGHHIGAFALYGYKKDPDVKGHLIIDEEGDLHSTLKAAEKEGLVNLKEANSQEYVGIRMADMFIGLISKVMQSLKKALTNDYANERIEKTLLEPGWFILDDRQLGLYKKLYQIICVDNKYWYSTYSGIYSDDLVVFIALLQFMSQFENAEALRNENYDILPEHFNAFVCQALQERYAVMGNKLPIEFVQNAGDDFFLNQRGAKVFYDESRQPLLPIAKGKNVYKVLSIGFGNTGTPMVTIESGRETVCYKLPYEYSEWAMTVVGCANMGEKLVPGEVVFSLENGKYYADIL